MPRENPRPDDGRSGAVVDPTANGYNAWAHQPGGAGTSGAAGRGIGTGASNSSSARGSAAFCDGAAAGALVAAPVGALGKMAVDCGIAQGQVYGVAVAPEQLARTARESLRLPLPMVRTAPPRRAGGLVGLPEWVWVPRAQWRPLSKRASAGGIWAEVTAVPERMVIEPGGGLATVTCAGPGRAYDPGKPASAQHSDCSFVYDRPSAAQPGSVFQVKVTVVWVGRWAGSDGSGGHLPDLSLSMRFSLRVVEAQGLYA